jgi:hypothetical protein
MTPCLYVAPAQNMVGSVSLIPLFLAGNSTPTILHMVSKRRDSGFSFGCADSAAVDGRRGSNHDVYQVNLWLWQFGRGKPRLGLSRRALAGPAPRGGGLRGDFRCGGSPRLILAASLGQVSPGGLGLTCRVHSPGSYSLHHQVAPRGGSAAGPPIRVRWYNRNCGVYPLGARAITQPRGQRAGCLAPWIRPSPTRPARGRPFRVRGCAIPEPRMRFPTSGAMSVPSRI